jgi:type I restriction enzyme S subunit
MNVRPGYKRTDVGVIPKDWHEVVLDHIAKRGSGHTPDKKHPEYWNGNIKWISLADSSALDQVFIDDTISYITREGLAHSSAVLHPPGTVVLSRDAGIGKSAIMRTEMAVSQHFMAWRCGPDLDNKFLYYWLQAAKPQFERIANGTTIKTIGLRYFKDLKLPVPPHREQRAIAEALSDVDALLGALDRLIAKNRDLKQAAMQQLLTGQIRLPGFQGDWKAKRLGNTAVLKARIGWQGLTTAEYLEYGDYHLVTGTEFKNGRIDWNSCHYVDESRYMQDKYIQLKKQDVLVTKDGTIGKVAIISDLPRPATLNSGVFVIRPLDRAFHPEFFYWLLCSTAFKDFLSQLSAGSTINHLYQKDFVTFVYTVPATIEEQIAIATVLSDMDAERSALDARRDKTRALKQAMMQELLTGKTRLGRPGGADA